MKKAIEINVLRVSSNGKYIEFIITCPEGYHFTDFLVGVYGGTDKYSLDCLFIPKEGEQYSEDDVTEDAGVIYWKKRHYIGQFLISDLGITDPEMFEIKLIAHQNVLEDIDTYDELEEYEITETAYISDVSNVYSCLMNDILSMGESLCENPDKQDSLIRNYLILYAHQEAMNMKEPKEARKYFELLRKCFTSCGSNSKSCSVCGSNANYQTYKPSNCGCNR